jgi:hypothetical protein
MDQLGREVAKRDFFLCNSEHVFLCPKSEVVRFENCRAVLQIRF